MKICFVCPEYPPGPHGGIGAMTQILARALVCAGHQVKAVGIYSPGYPAPDYEIDQGVQVWRIREPKHRFGWMRARVWLYQKIVQWAIQDEIALVEAPDYQGWVAGWPRLPIPVITRLHGSATYYASELKQRLQFGVFLTEKASLVRSNSLCSVSRYTAEKTKTLFGLERPVIILYNPVNIPETVPPFTERDPNKIVFTGTLTSKKGIISLLDAWQVIYQHNKNLALHILGKDGQAPTGENMRAYLYKRLPAEVQSSVQFYGHVSFNTLHQMLLSARVAVFPSYTEAFALAPMESMAAGCPTIYTQRVSGPELISNGINGLLVDPTDSGSIVQSILRVLSDDQFAESLGAAGRERARMFSMENILPQNETFYAQSIRNFKS